MLARESLFEMVRLSEFPLLPSRLSCSFVFESLDVANQYMGNFSPWNCLYEVEFVSPDAPQHRGGFDLITFPAPSEAFLPVVYLRARKYWGGEVAQDAEVITKSALKVRQLVSAGPACYPP